MKRDSCFGCKLKSCLEKQGDDFQAEFTPDGETFSGKQFLCNPECIGMRFHNIADTWRVAATHTDGCRNVILFAKGQNDPVALAAPFPAEGEASQFVGGKHVDAALEENEIGPDFIGD